MQKICSFSLLLVLGFAMLAACSTQPLTPTPTPGRTLEGTLRPYPTDTITPSPIPTGYVTPTLSPTHTPTLTPVYYTVQEKDDMFGIAWRYGISVEALKTANPSVIPEWMGVGTVLLIPLTPQAASSTSPTLTFTPTPTALYSKVHDPACYPDGIGGLTCFILVENRTEKDLENVGGVLTLRDTQSGETIQQNGIMLLNLLRANTAQPIFLRLEGPIPEQYTLSFEVDVIFPVPENDDRYLELTLSDVRIDYSQDQRSAEVTGSLQLLAEDQTSDLIWVLAVAYDANERVVGIRRYEAPQPLSSGESLAFSFFVYSMHGSIERVDLLTEARPLTP